MKTPIFTRHAFLLCLLAVPVLGAWSQGAVAGGKGMVKILTEPGDARIYVNGKRKGSSPSEKGQTFAIKLAEGEYRIEAVKPAEGPEEYYGAKEVFVAEDTLQTITIELKKRPSEAYRRELLARYPNGAPEPEMVRIEGGCYRMGSPDDEPGRDGDEGPQHRVCLKTFELGKHEVTFHEWDACVAMGGCTHLPDDEGWGRGDRPVINVSWKDVQAYIRWLNRATGKNYRLPSEAEWEYAARAGTTTPFYTGNCITTEQANYDGTSDYNNCGAKTGKYLKKTTPVGSYPPNPWGLYDMAGNVWEWVQDCWNDSYEGAPTDGSAWESGECGRRVVRGGSWYYFPRYLRSADRSGSTTGFRVSYGGFRLARTVTP